jgi:hypothetical protein
MQFPGCCGGLLSRGIKKSTVAELSPPMAPSWFQIWFSIVNPFFGKSVALHFGLLLSGKLFSKCPSIQLFMNGALFSSQ